MHDNQLSVYSSVSEDVKCNFGVLSTSFSDARCHSERRQPAGVCPCPGSLPEEVSVIIFVNHTVSVVFSGLGPIHNLLKCNV